MPPSSPSTSDAAESSAAKPDKQMTPRKATLRDQLEIIQQKYRRLKQRKSLQKDTPRKKKNGSVTVKQQRAFGGYMAGKLHKKACQQCRQSLTGSLTDSSTEVLLQKTQLKHAKEGLVIPSARLVCEVKIMECVLKTSGQLLHTDIGCSRLLHSLNKRT